MDEHLNIEKLQKEKRKAEKKGNLKEVAIHCNKIGELFSRQGHYEDAISEHETELRLCEALEDSLGVAVAHRRIGECLNELGNYKEALQHQQQYQDLAHECNSVLEQQRAYATLGRIHYQHAEQSTDTMEVEQSLNKAEAAFNKSLSMCEQLKEATSISELAEMQARIFLNLGLVYDFRNETKVCSDYFQKAIRIAEKHQLYEDMYRCQYNLSGIYQRTGNLGQALRFIDMAIKCASVNMRDKLAEREALALKMKVFLQLGDTSAAKKCLKKVLKMKLPTDKSENAQLAEILRNVREMELLKEKLKITSDGDNNQLLTIYEKLGDIAAKMECYQVALDYYLNSERCAISQNLDAAALIPIYISIAETYKDLHQYQSAINYFTKELDCRRGDAEQDCRTWLNIANIQELDGAEYCKIKESLDFALENAEKAKHRQLQALSLESLKVIQLKYGDMEGQQKTERDLEKLCVKYKVNLDDLSEQFTDDNCRADVCTSSQEKNYLDLDDISDSDCSTENEEKSSRCKKSSQVKLNEKGETPLHRACIAGNLSKVKTLVEQGHPINPRDYCGWLPLHEAANHGFVEVVDYLLDKGARIDDRGGDKCNGITPLHDACSCGNLPVIERLISRGASLHARDDQGNTPLDALVEYRHRCQEELTSEELNEIKALEQFLNKKMKADSLNGGSQRHQKLRATVTRAEKNVEVSVMPASKQRHKNMHAKDHVMVSAELVNNNVHIPMNPLCYDIKYLLDPCTASDAYKETISSLRGASHQKPQALEARYSGDNSPIPALIPESEMVGDDWLIDDVRCRKQKLQNIDSVFKTVYGSWSKNRHAKRKTAEQDQRSPKKQKKHISDYVSAEEDSGDGGNSCSYGCVLNPGPTEDLSVSRSSESGPVFVPTSSPCASSEPEGEEMARRSSQTSTLKLRIKVRIENNLILVPVHQNDVSHTVLWLANEASDRYYQLYSLRPILTLSLPDGAKLAPSDLISSIFANHEEVIGTVDRWDLPPLHTRYINICSQLKCTVYTNVKNRLLGSEHSCYIDLSGFCLCDLHFFPISRALQYQFAVKELNLEGNRLGDEGAINLWQVLSTLPNLMALNLSGNGLTKLSLCSLATTLHGTLEGGTLLQQLEKLVLSYNNFGDESALYFAKCISSLRNLHYLYLNSCCLTVRFFEQEQMHSSQTFQGMSITRLQVALNMIGSTGVELLLRSLPFTKIQSLNLSNTVSLSQSYQLLRHLNQYFTSGNCILEELCLDGCHLKSECMDDLCRLIVNCKSLCQLSISSNGDLTNADVEQVLTVSVNSRLSHFVFENCAIISPIDSHFLDSFSIKLQQDKPLREMRFTCLDLCQLDKDSLCEIWVSQWAAQAICNFSNLNHVSLTVSDAI